jgi:phosphatidylserine/phosphatidylglycerophosphate/cardiolipin synthase-like enzyme
MLLNSAQSKIRIQVYQYTTRDPHGSTEHWGELDSAIRAAGRRGVQVQLLVDRVALKTGQTGLTALAELENIEVRTVKIPEWSGGHLDFARLIHSKYLTVDGHSGWVGSENWSQNYFMTSRNVGVLFRVSDLVDRLDQVFDRVWSSPYASKQVEPEVKKNSSAQFHKKLDLR